MKEMKDTNEDKKEKECKKDKVEQNVRGRMRMKGALMGG
jgi:hypothetical protein